MENLPTPASDLGLEQSEARIDVHRRGKCMRSDIDLHEPMAERCWKAVILQEALIPPQILTLSSGDSATSRGVGGWAGGLQPGGEPDLG